jgi:hypothetical protein
VTIGLALFLWNYHRPRLIREKSKRSKNMFLFQRFFVAILFPKCRNNRLDSIKVLSNASLFVMQASDKVIGQRFPDYNMITIAFNNGFLKF